MYWVYVLKNLTGTKKYVGMTSNIERRLKEHNSGHTKSTKNNHWAVVYKEIQPDRISARKREKYLKSAAGRRYLKKMFP